MNIPITYWRLRIDNNNAFRDMINTSTAICPDQDFLLKVSRGHGICLASYDHATGCGHVRAVGVVIGSDTANNRLRVNWSEADITLKPNGQGQRYWRDRPYFAFAESVTGRYMLADIFAEHFPDLASLVNKADQPFVSDNTQSGPVGDMGRAGFVYLIKSPYGYKIGKTKNMKQRSQLFSVKLPFSIEILRYGWFDDYSSAEAQFHREYAHKRLEGEWFNLNEADIDAITRRMRT
jgi:hypothetical protein